MMPTFTTASEERIIGLIAAARTRLVLVAPAVSKTVANALAGRMANMPALSLTVILDADAEVYRMGYGDVEALDILRRAAEQPAFGCGNNLAFELDSSSQMIRPWSMPLFQQTSKRDLKQKTSRMLSF